VAGDVRGDRGWGDNGDRRVGAPAPSPTIPPAKWCAVQVDFVAETIGFELDDLDRYPDSPMWKYAPQSIARNQKHLRSCAPGAARDVVAGFTAAEAAAVAHPTPDIGRRDQADLPPPLPNTRSSRLLSHDRGPTPVTARQHLAPRLAAWRIPT